MRPTQTSAASRLESTRLRLTFLTLLVISLFVLLFARLWFLQVMVGERYQGLAQGNAVRTMSIEAPRGKLLGASGRPLVKNRYSMVVSVQLSEMGDRADQILGDLAELLGLPVSEIRERIDTSTVSPFRPKPVASDVPRDTVFYIHENGSTRFPGVYAESVPVRRYPHDATAAHLLGYLGEISEEELDAPEYVDYQPGNLIGWAGLERTYEAALRGDDGSRRFEVNATGDIVDELPDVLPAPGADVRTSIELKAQELTEDALRDGIFNARSVRDSETGRAPFYQAPAGAAVVMDPNSGEIVALASYPTFEPERFVGGVSSRYWRTLQDPDNHYPLINRGVQSSYPPGSVFKIVSAAAALDSGYMSRKDTLPCPGSWEWAGQVFNNWTSADLGSMDMAQALEQSCDSVFYELARDMWNDEQASGADVEHLPDMASAFGFGQPTGIDLPAERAGVVPGRDWKRTFWQDNRDVYCTQAKTADDAFARDLLADLCENGGTWRGGDAVNMSIGQGDMQTTPLQIANGFAAIANGGTLHRPHLGVEVVHPDGSREPISHEPLGQLPLRKRHLKVIQEGLERVASQGTAAATFGDFEVPVAGKTGTAEMKPKQPFAWFAAYAPADDPEYVVVTMVEEGGGGSLNAAPIARRVMEGLLDLEKTAIEPGETTD